MGKLSVSTLKAMINEKKLLGKYISVLETLEKYGIEESSYLMASYLGEDGLSFPIYKEDLPGNFISNKINKYQERIEEINGKIDKIDKILTDEYYGDFNNHTRIRTEIRNNLEESGKDRNIPLEFDVCERCPEWIEIAGEVFSVESIEVKNVGVKTSDEMNITLNLKGPE